MAEASAVCLSRPFDRKIILIFIAIVLDAVVTVWLMCQGFGEANPIMAWVAREWSIPGLAVVKITWSLCLLGLILEWQEFRNKYVNYLIILYFFMYSGGWAAQFIWEVIR